MSAVKRMHVAVNCSDLGKSLEFYRLFFGSEPAKVKDNYAKFELDNPTLHFSLNVRPFEKNGVLNHLGFQVDNTGDVLAMGERLRQANLLLIGEMNTTCCYAVQDKVLVYDPGTPGKFFAPKRIRSSSRPGIGGTCRYAARRPRRRYRSNSNRLRSKPIYFE